MLNERFTERLTRNFPGSTLTPRGDGSYLVRVPYALPDGWSAPSVDVQFICPVGFPSACPAYFYTETDFTLAGGRTPYMTSRQPGPSGETMRWWMWKTTSWNPNHDDLNAFARAIESRFTDLRADES